MRQAIVTLKKGEGRLLKSGGAWIFDNEIDSIMGEFENGDIVIVHDFDGYGMGRGFINMNSKIRIRMMTRKQDQEIDHAFLEMRVRDAWEYRKKTVDTSSCRVIFGEADFPTIMKLLGAVCFENYRGHLPCPCGSGLIARKCHGETILKLKKSGATEAFSSDFTTIACELTYLQQSAVKREQALRQTLISLPGKYRASNID